MKHITAILFLLLAISSCQQDKGRENARKYAEQQVSALIDINDVQEIEVGERDSILSDTYASFQKLALARKCQDHQLGKITSEQLSAFVDTFSTDIDDISHSILYGIVVNDSLSHLPKYQGAFRTVYPITVTMKNGVTKQFRVLMEEDGITPRSTERSYQEYLESEYTDFLLDVMSIAY